jgi:hypothetical protein
MNNSQNCYSYESVKSVNQKLNLEFNDEETRVLQHRLTDFNKLMNILFIEIFENNILGNGKPFLNNLKQKISLEANINISKKEITTLIENLIKNKENCKKGIFDTTKQQGGSYGWILPSNDKKGKGVDVFSLVLDFIGLVPGAMGNIADIINFFVNIYRGRHFDAGMSFLGLFSYIGLLTPFTKLGWRYYNKPEKSEESEEEISDEEEEENVDVDVDVDIVE